MRHDFLVLVAAACALMLNGSSMAQEVLPPSAYLNRTVYPAIINYSASRDGYPRLAIGLISDVQYADRPEKKRRHFRLSVEKLQHAVNEFNTNRTHLDCVVHLGDLVDSNIKAYLPVLQPILDRLRFPLYQVLGNHDFLGSSEEDFGNIHKMLKMPGRYYSVHAGPNNRYRLIFLDGNDLAIYSTKTGSTERQQAESILRSLRSRRAKNAKPFNGAMGSDQIDWMKSELNATCAQGQVALLFVHHPLRPRDEPTNLWNDVVVVPIITSYPCVAAVINGHAHKYLYDFHHTQFRHVHFITFGGMVQSPFTSFGFADVYDDWLHIHGLIFGREINFHYDLRPQETQVTQNIPSSHIVPEPPPPSRQAHRAPGPSSARSTVFVEAWDVTHGFTIVAIVIIAAAVRLLKRRRGSVTLAENVSVPARSSV